MADHGTAIEWTQAPGFKGETWNPVTGCDRVSPGCAHCYALDLAARLKGMGQKRYQRDGDPKTSGPGFGLTLHPDKLEQPLRWTKPRMVFVNSMSDLFHEEIPRSYIDDVFAVMAMAPRHIFQVLTKRPERMRDYFEDGKPWERIANRCYKINRYGSRGRQVANRQAWPLPNVWLGVTIENRRFNHRSELLEKVPAAVRFISAEPLLGPLVYDGSDDSIDHPWQDVMWSDNYEGPSLDLHGIDWIITGGESGPEHRRFDSQWALDLLHEARETGTAFFHKQNGGRTPKAGGRELNGRTYSEWPSQLQEVAA